METRGIASRNYFDSRKTFSSFSCMTLHKQFFKLFLYYKLPAMNYKIIQFPLYLIFILTTFIACNSGLNDVEAPSTENDYLVNSELVKSYTSAEIENLLSLAVLLYPEQRDEIEAIKGHVNSGVTVYRISYNTKFEGNDLQASGLVCLPDISGSYPILSYQNGTNTLHSAAPSVDLDNKLFQILEMMGSTGFIISLPDYIGFGVSDDIFHPYLDKESTVQTVTDMLRAIEELVNSEENIDWNKNVYLSGYSQGGWATMAVQKAIETKFAAEFNLKASACGAGPYNLITINQYVTGLEEYAQPYFLGYIFNSYINLGLTTPISEVFQAPYAERIPTLYDGTKSGGAINAELTTSMADFFTPDYLNGWKSDSKFGEVVEFLEKNSISAYKTKTPTMILHGTDDDLVTPVVSQDIYDDFIALGVSPELVSYIPLEGHNHTSGIVPSGLMSILWFLQLKEAEIL